MIASALLDQRAPSRNWYRNKQKTTNTDEVKGMLRVFLPDDPALDKFVFYFIAFCCFVLFFSLFLVGLV